MNERLASLFDGNVGALIEWDAEAPLDDDERTVLATGAADQGAAVAEPRGTGIAPLLVVAVVLGGAAAAATIAKIVAYIACRLKPGCTVDLRYRPPRIKKEKNLPGGIVIIVAADGSPTVHQCAENLDDIIKAGFELARPAASV